ncbi:MAG: molybdopterin molybdenumtransferase MoeA [Rhodospirillales bacterium]|nr:molybdopterin molybdenumtransferase MoeA [Rhodospirillales bacterium]MSP81061.1 molybdopterin molybdenumtransferase MoeA [Rhodospirillales bacterium]
MAQLKDDCFAFAGGLISFTEAVRALMSRVGPAPAPEEIALSEALGRILAEDIAAPCDVPPHDNAAVDGYAVFFADLNAEAETRLPVTGRVAAGHLLGRAARRGEAIRIFTGAPIPKGEGGGPDTVFMEEDVRIEGDAVFCPAGLKRGANLRRRGEDIKKNDSVLRQGRRLRPQDLGVAASVGRAKVPVYRRLKAAVFSTGDEVRDPVPGAEVPKTMDPAASLAPGLSVPPGGGRMKESPASPAGRPAPPGAPEGCIFDSNRYAVMGLLKGLGVAVSDLGILPDREPAIREALARAARTHDLLVTSGGVSAGEEDHVKAAIEAIGGRIDLWRLAIKPGRPVAFGAVAGAAFVGLPGNPVAALATFMRVARPMILKLAGASEAEIEPLRFRVAADFAYDKKAGRREWVRAKLVSGANGGMLARKVRGSGSGILTSMTEADGLVELTEEIETLAPGQSVDFIPFSELLA